MQFFQDTLPGSTIVDESETTVQSFGHGSGNTPESARACLEHALRVCREGGHKVRGRTLLKLPICSAAREPSLFTNCVTSLLYAHARLRSSTFFQPCDFLLLRFNLVKNRGNADVKIDSIDLSGVAFVRSLTVVAGEFACVGHYVDQCMLSLAGPSRRPPAAHTPPERQFAPPLGLSRKTARVVQLWGLRHCVLAAKEHLGGVVSQRIRRTLPLNVHAVRLTTHAFERQGVHFPGVSSSVGVRRSRQAVIVCCSHLWRTGRGCDRRALLLYAPVV